MFTSVAILPFFYFFADFDSRFNFRTDFPSPEHYKDTPKTYPSRNPRATMKSKCEYSFTLKLLSLTAKSMFVHECSWSIILHFIQSFVSALWLSLISLFSYFQGKDQVETRHLRQLLQGELPHRLLLLPDDKFTFDFEIVVLFP